MSHLPTFGLAQARSYANGRNTKIQVEIHEASYNLNIEQKDCHFCLILLAKLVTWPNQGDGKYVYFTSLNGRNLAKGLEWRKGCKKVK